MTLHRFAPSPTGYLHIGNARTAIWNALLARKSGGQFLLRFDDTDIERSEEKYAAGILEDLNWLGIPPDRIERQSSRFDRYAGALEKLIATGHAYACYETQDELDKKRKRLQVRGLPPVYDRAGLTLTDEQRAAYASEGRKPYYRFKLSHQTVRWQDGVRGACHIESASLSDPILARADGAYLYTFASVVDDAELGVTDILRGEDHVSNTAVQIEIFAALGYEPPRFAHHNLIASATGEEMSKRTGALSLRSFREEGVDPLAVTLVAALTGTSEAVRPLASLDELASLLEPGKFSRALTKFDPAEIRDLSTRLLHAKPYAAVADALAALGIAGSQAEALWAAIHGNVSRIEEALAWWRLIGQPQHFAGDDAEFLREAAQLLPPAPFGPETWGLWTKAISEKTGRKGKALFMPLRLALTGLDHGPELKALLPLILREEVIARLAPARQP